MSSAEDRMVEPESRPCARPPRLNKAAQTALLEAEEVLGPDFSRFRTAVDRYVNAIEVADAARREWEKLGRPKSTRGSIGQEVEHPLIRTMDRLDTSANRFAAELGLTPASAARMGRKAGRPPGAVSAADRKSPPAVKLKAV